MSAAIDRTGLRPRYWETTPLERMTPAEWEALCDGCGKCCLNKLEDEDSGDVALTRVACRLFDDSTCLCSNYEMRRHYVPECVSLTPKTLDRALYWLPQTCAYKLLRLGKPLYSWHPLISGDPHSVQQAGVSVRGATVSESSVHEDDWESHLIEEPGA